jgi:hypothetical protein
MSLDKECRKQFILATTLVGALFWQNLVVTPLQQPKQYVYAVEETPSAEKTKQDNFIERLSLFSTEVMVGKVVSADNRMEEYKDDYRFFELKITSVEKSSNRIRVGQTIKVKYKKEATILGGYTPVQLAIGDTIKIYGEVSPASQGNVELKYAGDSIEIIEKGTQSTYYKGLPNALDTIANKIPLEDEKVRIALITVTTIVLTYLVAKLFKIK